VKRKTISQISETHDNQYFDFWCNLERSIFSKKINNKKLENNSQKLKIPMNWGIKSKTRFVLDMKVENTIFCFSERGRSIFLKIQYKSFLIWWQHQYSHTKIILFFYSLFMMSLKVKKVEKIHEDYFPLFKSIFPNLSSFGNNIIWILSRIRDFFKRRSFCHSFQKHTEDPSNSFQ